MSINTNTTCLLSNPSNHDEFRDSMGSDLFLNQSHVHEHGGGLGRYRSAPSSFMAALLDSTTDNSSSSGDESEALLSALMDGNQKSSNGGNGQMGFESVIVGSYSVDLRMNNNNGSNLARQSTSPAGFFNGYGIMGEVGNYRVHNNHPKSTSSASRFMPSIPENVTESISTDSPNNKQLCRATSANAGEFEETFFPQDSWINTLKRTRDDDAKMFSSQNGETRKNHHGLVHHLSLPKTSAEMSEVEKFLQLKPEAVACQIRAKRGCATHPRSIAERMRRSKISEKMKKLQDLFPNMDKQTNTADMLDLAVEFIKDLQKQVDTLTQTKSRCVCSNTTPQTSLNS